MAEIRIFISSVQAEFASERKRLCDYIRQDALLGRFFIPFIFEELPALNTSAQEAFFKVIIYRKASNDDKFGQSNIDGNDDKLLKSNNDIIADNISDSRHIRDFNVGKDSEQSNKDSNNDNLEQSNIESNIRRTVLDVESLSYQQQVVVNFCYVPRTSTEILKRLGLTRQTKNIKSYISDLVEMGFLKMIDPEHPRSKNQKYIKV